ncbi:hypothetical protein FVR03_01250 [Pontibacter qinzhouensis]|uniref:DUF7167 domain-containing protein n=1 Tax=Pontibacter qinzhouensis TaxID=2603253 RepID=A0A5C8KD80_9BACT|nr:hypothetical protein [Pontibacter qinzhouensis]TXK52370.1 hypothetical protein FVR03_01250 [Pontibacter qinzhouensis]
MRKIKIEVSLGIGYAARREEKLEIEVEDEATPEQIEMEAGEAAEQWANNYIDLGFEILD